MIWITIILLLHFVIFHEEIVQDLEDHKNQILQLSYHSVTVATSIALNLDRYSYVKDEILLVVTVSITSVHDLIVKKPQIFSLVHFFFSLYLEALHVDERRLLLLEDMNLNCCYHCRCWLNWKQQILYLLFSLLIVNIDFSCERSKCKTRWLLPKTKLNLFQDLQLTRQCCFQKSPCRQTVK